ncbi:MAG: hypothetical protein BM485_14005 [Desulfobulbaceae bacterium DB1]|nr:MAG: hypothetical protein BM485_14005 [Desulfobulbaceae bacterium DB1]
MKCARENCREEIPDGEERNWHGQLLCEDCYMDALSPAKTCDPWAVRSATMSRDIGETTEHSGLQAQILRQIRQSGGISPAGLAETLAVRLSDIEREIAALRHMEKVRAAMQDGKKVIVLW